VDDEKGTALLLTTAASCGDHVVFGGRGILNPTSGDLLRVLAYLPACEKRTPRGFLSAAPRVWAAADDNANGTGFFVTKKKK